MELGSDAKRAPVPTIASRRGRFIGRHEADAARVTGAIPRGRAPWLAAAVLASVLVVALALAWTSRSLYQHNERRLLDSRVRELGLVLAGAVPAIQTPLASAAALADATDGDRQKFRAFMAPYVGPGRQFTSVSLWPLGTGRLAPTVVAGSPPLLATRPSEARALFAKARHTRVLSVAGILGAQTRILGYELNASGDGSGFAVYAESALPQDRRSRRAGTAAFSDLNYAIYLGHSRRPQELLATNISRFPIKGRQASNVVPFGDSALLLVVTPNRSLSGTVFDRLPWIIVGVGVLLALAAAAMTDRLARRRHQAEQLAGTLDRIAAENRELYTEQRSIAQSLQHAMLPEALPAVPGLDVSARFVPAASDIEIGGDWYDIVVADERRVMLVIGDVSGHGLDAAVTMASVRHAALAYASQDGRPASVLTNLAAFVNRSAHDYFATVLCALIDIDSYGVTVASAGHPPLLVLDGDESWFVELAPGPAIGAPHDMPYHETTVTAPSGATLVAFTDGLIERRGETLNVGLARLRDTATTERRSLEGLMEKLVRDLAVDGRDDTAILGVRWQS
jgi:serine phosphatase RsbU (regulator of sigma subunit)